jgi:hypothetical protein
MHDEPSWMQAFLAVHVAAGTSCLVLAPLVLTFTKGGARHRRWGKIYFWSMGAVAATALPMALFRPVLFLALVAVLSFYLTFSGYRVLRLKNLPTGGSAEPIDWAAAALTFVACGCLAGFGLFRSSWVQHMGIVAIVLGALGMRGTAADLYRFAHRPTQRMFWLYVHLEKFIGSYIAIWTAFSVVTLSQLFHHAGLAIWLWPTAVGVPAIAATVAYYRYKYAVTAPYKSTGLQA